MGASGSSSAKRSRSRATGSSCSDTRSVDIASPQRIGNELVKVSSFQSRDLKCREDCDAGFLQHVQRRISSAPSLASAHLGNGSRCSATTSANKCASVGNDQSGNRPNSEQSLHTGRLTPSQATAIEPCILSLSTCSSPVNACDVAIVQVTNPSGSLGHETRPAFPLHPIPEHKVCIVKQENNGSESSSVSTSTTKVDSGVFREKAPSRSSPRSMQSVVPKPSANPLHTADSESVAKTPNKAFYEGYVFPVEYNGKRLSTPGPNVKRATSRSVIKSVPERPPSNVFVKASPSSQMAAAHLETGSKLPTNLYTIRRSAESERVSLSSACTPSSTNSRNVSFSSLLSLGRTDPLTAANKTPDASFSSSSIAIPHSPQRQVSDECEPVITTQVSVATARGRRGQSASTFDEDDDDGSPTGAPTTPFFMKPLNGNTCQRTSTLYAKPKSISVEERYSGVEYCFSTGGIWCEPDGLNMTTATTTHTPRSSVHSSILMKTNSVLLGNPGSRRGSRNPSTAAQDEPQGLRTVNGSERRLQRKREVQIADRITIMK